MNSLPWGPLINPFMTPCHDLIRSSLRVTPESGKKHFQKMLPANNRPMSEIAREKGISECTLHDWREAARTEGQLMPDGAIPVLRAGGIRQVHRSAGNSLDESNRVIHLLSTKRPVSRAACSITYGVWRMAYGV